MNEVQHLLKAEESQGDCLDRWRAYKPQGTPATVVFIQSCPWLGLGNKSTLLKLGKGCGFCQILNVNVRLVSVMKKKWKIRVHVNESIVDISLLFHKLL